VKTDFHRPANSSCSRTKRLISTSFVISL